MGLFKKPIVSCPAGAWTRVIFDFGKGFPETMELELALAFSSELETPDSVEITAEYRETHYNWIFPKQPVTGEMASSRKFSRRWIDGIYSVYIKPSTDCVARIR